MRVGQSRVAEEELSQSYSRKSGINQVIPGRIPLSDQASALDSNLDMLTETHKLTDGGEFMSGYSFNKSKTKLPLCSIPY
jgi:predicted site-specific integrase-resolvase